MMFRKLNSGFAVVLMAALMLGAVLPLAAQNGRRGSDARASNRSRQAVSAQAVSDGQGAYVFWQSRSESGVVGYDLYRLGPEGRVRVNDAAFVGGGLATEPEASEGRKFSHFDPQGTVSSFYQVEVIRMEGYRQVAASTVAEQVSDLVPFAGYTSQELLEAYLNGAPDPELAVPAYPKTLESEMSFAAAAPDPTNQKFVAGQAGVKISVRQDGMYRVTRTALQAAGFNVSTPIKYWRLFGDGNEVAIREAADGSYIEFYGRGRDVRESDTRVYYLIGGSTKGRRMNRVFSRATAGPAAGSSFSTTYVKKFRSRYTSSLLNGDLENYFGDLISTASINTSITLNAVDLSKPSASMTVRLQGIVNLSHAVSVSVNGTPVGTVTGSNKNSFTGTFTVPMSALVEGTNTVSFVSTLSGAFSYVDTITVGYAKKFTAADNTLSYFSEANKQVTVGGFSGNDISVYDITDPEQPKVFGGVTVEQPQVGLYSAKVITTKGRALFAVSTAGYLSPASLTANTPSTLSSTSNSAGLLIVSHKNFMTEANAWADYRRGQGFTVKVVDIEDVFDEFSYGSSSTEGMSAFFSFAKSSWTVKPDYVLLIGDATYDHRGYENRPFGNYIPSRLFDTDYEETSSDDAIVDFDNDGLAEMAIGRIPARTGSVVTLMLTKTQTFEATAPTALAGRGAAFAHDQPDALTNWSFQDTNSRLAAKLPSGTPTVSVLKGTGAKALLVSALNNGPMIINYAGHGSVGIWASSDFFGQADAAALTNGDRLTVFMMLTCLNGYFIFSNSDDGLSEVLIKNPNGGAPAAWASTGKTTPDYQELMASRFFTKFGDGSFTRLGDLIRDSKMAFTGTFAGRSVRLSWTLLGDPMLKMR